MYESKVMKSFKPLGICEKFACRDTAGATKLVDLLDNNSGRFTINNVCNVVKTAVHNDRVKDDNKEYSNIFIMTADGDVYYSSSETLWSDLEGMIDVFSDEEQEVALFDISIIAVPSRNNQQAFLKARLIDVKYAL